MTRPRPQRQDVVGPIPQTICICSNLNSPQRDVLRAQSDIEVIMALIFSCPFSEGLLQAPEGQVPPGPGQLTPTRDGLRHGALGHPSGDWQALVQLWCLISQVGLCRGESVLLPCWDSALVLQEEASRGPMGAQVWVQLWLLGVSLRL